MTDEVLDALASIKQRRTREHWCTPGCPSHCEDFGTPVVDPDVEKLVSVLVEVRAQHAPYRTHSVLSNPDHWYDVCVNCPDEAGDWHLWPCPTGRALEKLKVTP